MKYIITIILALFFSMSMSECVLYMIGDGYGGNNSGSDVCAVACADGTLYGMSCSSDLFNSGGYQYCTQTCVYVP